MGRSRLRIICILAVFLAALVVSPAAAAPQTQDPIWIVTYPTDGAVVSGQVAIQGTASHPNFASYGVLYASGPNPTGNSQWVPIVFGAASMVVNGPLATWDTTQIPNGQYTLALAVYEAGNDTPNLHFVNNVTVNNEAVTPTPEPSPTPAEPTEAPESTQEAGPIIAPTVEQPPTVTPRPTATLMPGDVTAPEEAGEEGSLGIIGDLLSGAALKESFMSGVWIAVLLYAIGGLYVAARAALRYFLRQQKQGRNSS